MSGLWGGGDKGISLPDCIHLVDDTDKISSC